MTDAIVSCSYSVFACFRVNKTENATQDENPKKRLVSTILNQMITKK